MPADKPKTKRPYTKVRLVPEDADWKRSCILLLRIINPAKVKRKIKN